MHCALLPCCLACGHGPRASCVIKLWYRVCSASTSKPGLSSPPFNHFHCCSCCLRHCCHHDPTRSRELCLAPPHPLQQPLRPAVQLIGPEAWGGQWMLATWILPCTAQFVPPCSFQAPPKVRLASDRPSPGIHLASARGPPGVHQGVHQRFHRHPPGFHQLPPEIHQASPRAPPGVHQSSTGLLPEFQRAFARVPPGSARVPPGSTRVPLPLTDQCFLLLLTAYCATHWCECASDIAILYLRNCGHYHCHCYRHHGHLRLPLPLPLPLLLFATASASTTPPMLPPPLPRPLLPSLLP